MNMGPNDHGFCRKRQVSPVELEGRKQSEICGGKCRWRADRYVAYSTEVLGEGGPK
jgi:hypothetical protein